MVKPAQFNAQIARTIGSRARMTAVRNNIAALRGASYYPHEQDRLNLEVKALGHAMEVDPVEQPNAFYESRMNSVEGLNEAQTGTIEMVNDLIEQRKQMLSAYGQLVDKAAREQAVIEETNTKEHKQLKSFLAYVGKNIQNSDAIVNMDGATYAELKAKYDRDAATIATAQSNLEQLQSDMSAAEDDIRKQDMAIREAAIVAGIDLPSAFSSVGDYLSGSIPPFIIGGFVAAGALLILGSQRGPMAPQRGRRGSAMNVFLGR